MGCGENHSSSKLIENEVLEIYNLWESEKYTQEEIGNFFGVTTGCISGIVHGYTWKELYKKWGYNIKRKNKLTEEQVAQIKKDPRLWQWGGVTQIAKEYGVSRKIICSIKHGKT